MAKRESLTGCCTRLLLGTEKGNLVTREVPEVQVTWEGFAGDRHAGQTRKADVRTPWFPRGTPVFNTRQVSLVSAEELALVAQRLELPRVTAAWLGANLELEGVPHLTLLPAGTRLLFPEGAALVIEGENVPCTQVGRVLEAHHPERKGLTSRFVKAAMGLRGLVGWVERPGVARVGDTVTVMLPPPVRYPRGSDSR